MNERTEGAWIIHHTKKIQTVEDSTDFGDIEIAGKSGLFLSSLAASDQTSILNPSQVNAIATASNIKKIELDAIKNTLKNAKLIDVTKDGSISVIGITTSNVLLHTSAIFKDNTNDDFQKASLELSNYIADTPKNEQNTKQYISDTFCLDSKKTERLFTEAEEIGLIDCEVLDTKKVYFNGNLFKRDSIAKTTKVLESLKSEDVRKVNEMETHLNNEGCVTLEFAKKILGDDLLSKLQSIAMYDFNEVSNNTHSKIFITKPAAFAKFGNPFEDDALDLAKAFIAALYYGMKVSSSNRGKIQNIIMLRNTLMKLLRGEKVGPCTAIGQDYQILELNRVIQLEHYQSGMYFMTLLKYDIANIALDVLTKGDLADYSVLDNNLSSNASLYSGPEKNRMKVRRKKPTSQKYDVGELIRTMRK